MTQQKIVYIFPGQGSQYAGMGSDLYGEYPLVRQHYQQASDILGIDLAKLSFNDLNGEIHLTRYTQPAILTHSMSCWRLFAELTNHSLPATAMAGHSLGEYSALVASDSLSFANTVRLVHRRGSLMSEFGEGEMEALPLDRWTAESLASKHYCSVAACNLPNQTVVAGSSTDLDALQQDFQRNYPEKTTVRLRTEGAFHTYFMTSAALKFKSELKECSFSSPKCHVYSNFTGLLHDRQPDAIRSKLFFQLFSPVLWLENMTHAIAEADLIIEFGGGIGKGTEPEHKRANLEMMIKKMMRGRQPMPKYHSVVNLKSLDLTVNALI